MLTVNRVLKDDEISRIADSIIALQESEDTTIPALKKQLADTERGIENILNAIQQGILTSSTKEHLETLERQKESLQPAIAQAELQKPKYTKEQVVSWINQFKYGDADSIEYKKHIIDTFVNAIYLFGDKIVITYNFKGGTETITMKDIEAAYGSDMTLMSPPKETSLSLIGMFLFMLVEQARTREGAPSDFIALQVKVCYNRKQTNLHLREGYMLNIRDAAIEDFERVMEIYKYAQDYMIQSGNPTQWGHFYPDAALVQSDIRQNVCKIIYDENGIHGVFALFEGADPTYAHIENGHWLNDEPYVTIHRLAGDGQAHGLFQCAMDYCKNISRSIRVDTHSDNQTMQKLAEKNGFTKCGIIYVEDGSPRIAYQWSATILFVNACVRSESQAKRLANHLLSKHKF